MSYRNLLAMGLLNALLCAGFNNNALGGSFTNGDFITYDQADWGDTTDLKIAAALVSDNYDTVYASSSGLFEVGIPGTAGFSMVFSGAPELLAYLPDIGAIGTLDSD